MPKWLRMKKSAFGVTQLAREEKSNALLKGEFDEAIGGFALSCLVPRRQSRVRPPGNTNIFAKNLLRVWFMALALSD
jgi:hypothetical protein